MGTASETPHIQTRFFHSQELPGQVCAQAFCKPRLGEPDRYLEMQTSNWHSNMLAATEDLEQKIKLDGFKKASL